MIHIFFSTRSTADLMHDVVVVLATPVICESDAPEVLPQLVEGSLYSLASVLDLRANLVELVHDLNGVSLGRHLLLQGVDLVH